MPECTQTHAIRLAVEGGGVKLGRVIGKKAQIWQIITYMRAGFPRDPAAEDATSQLGRHRA
jgi:hypothetical protein